MSNTDIAKTPSVLDIAFEEKEAACAKNVCIASGELGAQWLVRIRNGNTSDGKPKWEEAGFIIRKRKGGPVQPNLKSECPADRFAAALVAQKIEYKIVPSDPLQKFFDLCKQEKEKAAENDENARLQDIVSKLKSKFS